MKCVSFASSSTFLRPGGNSNDAEKLSSATRCWNAPDGVVIASASGWAGWQVGYFKCCHLASSAAHVILSVWLQAAASPNVSAAWCDLHLKPQRDSRLVRRFRNMSSNKLSSGYLLVGIKWLNSNHISCSGYNDDNHPFSILKCPNVVLIYALYKKYKRFS